MSRRKLLCGMIPQEADLTRQFGHQGIASVRRIQMSLSYIDRLRDRMENNIFICLSRTLAKLKSFLGETVI